MSDMLGILDDEMAIYIDQGFRESGFKTLTTIDNGKRNGIYVRFDGYNTVEVFELSTPFVQKFFCIPVDSFKTAFHPDLVAKVLGEEDEFINAPSGAFR